MYHRRWHFGVVLAQKSRILEEQQQQQQQQHDGCDFRFPMYHRRWQFGVALAQKSPILEEEEEEQYYYVDDGGPLFQWRHHPPHLVVDVFAPIHRNRSEKVEHNEHSNIH